MKSLIVLLQLIIHELGDRYRISTTKDVEYILRRFEDEGFSFLTITLPNFGKDFERCLDLGYVDPHCFAGFARRGSLPLFLGGFLDLIFDRGTGYLWNDDESFPVTADAIFSVRQICLLLAKIELDCSPKRVRQAFRNFVSSDLDVRRADSRLLTQNLDKEIYESFLDLARRYGQEHFLESTNLSTLEMSYLSTDLVQLQRNFLATRSFSRALGPDVWRDIFLVGNIYFQTGVSTKNSSPLTFWSLRRNFL